MIKATISDWTTSGISVVRDGEGNLLGAKVNTTINVKVDGIDTILSDGTTVDLTAEEIAPLLAKVIAANEAYVAVKYPQ